MSTGGGRIGPRRVIRLVLVCAIAVLVVGLAAANPSALPGADAEDERDYEAPPRPAGTAISLQEGELLVFQPDGSLRYRNDSHDSYWDVDVTNGANGTGNETLLYTASDELSSAPVCEPIGPRNACLRQTIERVNLTTGEVTRLHTRITPRAGSSEWHDIDRLNATHGIVADMYADRVFVVEYRTGLVTWEWDAQAAYPLSSGGLYPSDWTHLNDVEVLPDGRIMVSLRNQDQVAFVHPNGTLDEEWTLGTDDNHDVLYEQHNPDYIQGAGGNGSAVLIADSEQNRVVEFRREAGEWEQSWVWQNADTQWPRDADRLPNGHTLITNTHDNSVLEIDQSGEVVWEISVAYPYDVERLGTGDESAGGPTATEANLDSRRDDPSESETPIRDRVKALFPARWVNGLISVLPRWVGLFDLVALGVLGVAIVTWAILEWRWARVTLQLPIRFRER